MGAGCCHLGGGEGGRWPVIAGPSGGLRRALLDSWAKPAAHGCGGPAASSSGNLATPPILTTHPCPAFTFDTHGWPFASHGCCCGLTARGYPSSCPMSCQAMPAGEPAKQPEAPKLLWPRTGGVGGEDRVAGTLPRPR